MRPIHPVSTLILLTAATAAAGQDCTWETRFEGIDVFDPPGIVLTVLTADVDGDGDDDTVVTEGTDAFTVMIDNGAADPTLLSFETLGRTSAGAVGDFDLDGHVDLAMRLRSGGVAVHLGRGDGTFDDAGFVDFGIPETLWYLHDIAAVDTNHDGALDLVITDVPAHTIGVLRGHGDGTFEAALVYPTGATPASIAVLDANADGSVDLVTANYDSANLSVLLNLGDGTYAPAMNVAAGGAPADVVTGDFDGDGVADLAVAEYDDSTISTYIGAGDGTFAHGATRWVGGGVGVLSPIDLDGDQYTDLVSARGYGVDTLAVIALFTGDTGADDPGLAVGPVYSHYGVHAVGDVNGDGLDDVVAHGRAYDVLWGRGDGTLDGQPALAMDGVALAAADMNGDGIADLVGTDDGNTSHLRVALARGDGSFDDPMVTIFDDTCELCPTMETLAVGDIDNDGDIDVVASRGVDFHVLRNAGDGTLSIDESYATYADPSSVSSLAKVELADLNEDGLLDILVAHHSAVGGLVEIRFGLGDGIFGAAETLSLGSIDLEVADLNGDGHVDLVALDFVDPTPYFARRLGNGDGTFGSRKAFATEADGVAGMAIADLDADGAMDLILCGGMFPEGLQFPVLEVRRGRGDGFFDPAETYAPPGPGFLWALAVEDLDGDGVLDVASNVPRGSDPQDFNSVFVFPGGGDGTLEEPILAFRTVPDWTLVAADFDDNGAPDLAVGGAKRVLTVHLNHCAGTVCPEDLDGNGAVDVADLLDVLSAWGACAGCPQDIDGDGAVGVTDLLGLLAAWGPCA